MLDVSLWAHWAYGEYDKGIVNVTGWVFLEGEILPCCRIAQGYKEIKKTQPKTAEKSKPDLKLF